MRTFAGASEQHGSWRLDDFQAAVYRNRLSGLSTTISSQFNMTPDTMYGFLRHLIEIYEKYERVERNKLSAVLKQDIFAWELLIGIHTSVNRQDIAAELGRTNYHDQRTFLYLDPAAKERDYALSRIKHAAQVCGDRLRGLGDFSWAATDGEIEEFLDFCGQEGLGLINTSISGMVAVGDEEHEEKYRRVERYTNLKNVLTSYEYLLKCLAVKGQLRNPSHQLANLTEQVMRGESWFSLFKRRMDNRLTQAFDIAQFINNLDTLRSDSQLDASADGYCTRMFLVTCLARNGTVHQYPSEDRYYGDLFSDMLHAPIGAMLYTWKFARSSRWV